MSRSDKELAVELAVAVISTIPQMQSLSPGIKRPINGDQVNDILKDCYNAVHALPDSE